MKALKKDQVSLLLTGALLLLALVMAFFSVYRANAGITTEQHAVTGFYRDFTFFATSSTALSQASVSTSTTANAATSTNVVSYFDSNSFLDNGYMVVAGAFKISLNFYRDATSTGSMNGNQVFTVQATNVVSPKESDWFNYSNMVVNLPTSTPTTQSFVLLSGATSTQMVSFQLGDSVYAVRCIVKTTLDGNARCHANASF